MMKDLKINFASTKNMNDAMIQKHCDLINEIYDNAEGEMWKNDRKRIIFEELKKLIEENKLIIGTYKGQIISSIVVKQLDDGVSGEFSILVCHPTFRHRGIGTLLIEAVENWAKAKKLHQMTLELWTPEDRELPKKTLLKKWYSKLGYTPMNAMPVQSKYPIPSEMFNMPCVFTVWIKKLTT